MTKHLNATTLTTTKALYFPFCLKLLTYIQIGLHFTTATEKSIVYGHEKYVEYQAGSMNSKLIITSPHGGYDTADDLPIRQHGCWDDASRACSMSRDCPLADDVNCPINVKNDYYTKDIALMLRDEVEKLVGDRPHLILNNIFRNKLDPNRPVEEAAQHNPDAMKAWEDFHNFIGQAESTVQGPGILLDIHGHGHPENWIELGYLIRSEELDSGNLESDASSIRSLANSVKSHTSLWQLLNGRHSLGGLLESEGYKVVPSPGYPSPKGGKYYRGGYITQEHGSRNGGLIDAIQIETPKPLRNSKTAPDYCKALARAVTTFMNRYY